MRKSSEVWVQVYSHEHGDTFEIYRGNILFGIVSTNEEVEDIKAEAQAWRR